MKKQEAAGYLHHTPRKRQSPEGFRVLKLWLYAALMVSGEHVFLSISSITWTNGPELIGARWVEGGKTPGF